MEGGLGHASRSPFWHSVICAKGKFRFNFPFRCTLAMASMDPTPEEIEQWTDLSSVLTWAGLSGDPAEVTSPAGSFLRHIGYLSTAAVRMLGIIPANDLTEFLRDWKIDGQDATPAHRAQPALVGSGARVASGTQRTIADTRAAAAEALAAASAAPAASEAPAVSSTRLRQRQHRRRELRCLVLTRTTGSLLSNCQPCSTKRQTKTSCL